MEIVNYPNYLVYEDGRVFSKKRRKMLKPIETEKGYHIVGLYNDGKQKLCKVHRLVAQAYIPNQDNKPEVDHIDRDRSNNHVSNLRWATHSENRQNTICQSDNQVGIKNISYYNNKYCYQKMLRGNPHRKFFKTLEEAHAYKIEYEQMIEAAETLVSSASS